jgi:AcrR family transcriptional regulator
MPKVVDHAERRDRVAAVAEQVIADRGLGAGLRDVALAGGWSTSVVTHYFATKDELLEHTLRRTIEGAAARIDARVARGESRLAAILEENLPLDARRRRQWRIFIAFWGRAVHDSTLEQAQRRRHTAFRSALAEALAAAFPPDTRHDPALEARRLFALLDGLAVQALFEPREWPARLQIELVERHLAELGLTRVLDRPARTRGPSRARAETSLR